jgi:hypothetical protein
MKTKHFEQADERLTGKTRAQVHETTRYLRKSGMWPIDRSGGGRGSIEVPIECVANRILSVGSPILAGLGPYVTALGQTQFTTTQHDLVQTGSRVDRLLSLLAVKELDPGDRRQTQGFIRGADPTLHEVVVLVLDAIRAASEVADLSESLQAELELISAPSPFEIVACLWLHEGGQRYGWTYQKRQPSKRDSASAIPTRVLVRSTKIPAAWFVAYAALLAETPGYDVQEAA